MASEGNWKKHVEEGENMGAESTTNQPVAAEEEVEEEVSELRIPLGC